MKDIDNMRPYAKAYFKVVKPDKFVGGDYIVWITKKHKEFRKINKLQDYSPYTPDQEEEFIEFINIE